ncbi:MAG: hypothetical protein AB4041_12475 [Microcystaceae cyanobacterium]
MIKRRDFLSGLIGVILVHQLFNRKLLAQENETVTIHWRVPREQVPTVRDDLNFQGKIIPDESTREDDRGLPLIYILIGAVALGSLAKTLLDIYKDARYGGVIVQKNDKGEIVIENDPRLDKGTIIVEQGDEIKVIFKKKDDPQTKELIEALTPLVTK